MNMRQKKKRMKIKVLQGNPDDIVKMKYTHITTPEELEYSFKVLQKAFSPHKVICIPDFITCIEYDDADKVIGMCEDLIKILKRK